MDVSPTPWFVEVKDTKTGQSLRVINRNAGVVALVKDAAGRKLGNAYLLAAAPELLDCLVSLLDETDGDIFTDAPEYAEQLEAVFAAQEKARALIAKVKGE